MSLAREHYFIQLLGKGKIQYGGNSFKGIILYMDDSPAPGKLEWLHGLSSCFFKSADAYI